MTGFVPSPPRIRSFATLSKEAVFPSVFIEESRATATMRPVLGSSISVTMMTSAGRPKKMPRARRSARETPAFMKAADIAGENLRENTIAGWRTLTVERTMPRDADGVLDTDRDAVDVFDADGVIEGVLVIDSDRIALMLEIDEAVDVDVAVAVMVGTEVPVAVDVSDCVPVAEEVAVEVAE